MADPNRPEVPRSRLPGEVTQRDRTFEGIGPTPPRARLQRQTRRGADYWTLMMGSGRDRISLTIGATTTDDARRYLAGIECVRLLWVRATDFQGLPLDAMLTREDLHLVPPPPPGATEELSRWQPVRPEWLVDYGRHGSKQRAEVLRYLSIVGGYENAVAALTDGPLRAQVATPDLNWAPKLPAMRANMPLKQYVDLVWAEVRKAEYPDTWARERRLWDLHLLPALGHLRVCELEAYAFDEFIGAETRKDGQPLSGNTRRLIRAAYQAMLIDAEKKRVIKEVHKFYRLKGSTKKVLQRPKPLSDAEIDALIEAAPTLTHAALFAVSFELGLRPGEIPRVGWGDVDWLAQSGGWGGLHVRGTKTDSSDDVIPLGPRSRVRLRELWETLGRPVDGPVFTYRGRPILSCRTALKRAADRAGISEGRRIFQYLGRHTAATAVSRRANREVAAALLRHTSPKMVEATYDHTTVSDRVDPSKLFGPGGVSSEGA